VRAGIYGEGGTKADPFAGLGKIGSTGFIPKPAPRAGMPAAGARGNVTINVNNPNATAPDIIKKLDDYYRATGARLN
jgi:hypothetical protein